MTQLLLPSAKKTRVTFTEEARHTVYFEGDMDVAGYIIVNMPIEDWHDLGSPKELVVTLGVSNVD